MNRSESIVEIAKALTKAQSAMENASKNKENPHFKSRYADLAGVIEAIKQPLLDNGLAYTQVFLPTEHDRVSVETVLMHSSGEWISGIITIPVTRADPQGHGSAITYARRYSLAAIGGIAAEDDDDANAGSAGKKKITPTAGAWESLDKDRREYLTFLADGTKSELATRGAEAAVALIDAERLSIEEKVALWTRFDSKERSAMQAAAAKRTGAS